MGAGEERTRAVVYEVCISQGAKRQLKALARELRNRIQAAIDGLATAPRPHGVVKLSGNEHYYRIRVGDYRIIYEIHDCVLVVIVIEIGHRREIYR